ncbi:MAG: phosphoribosylamine--glycine ligase, partial [Nitrospirae bacterium]|nr:phosphoribosylamine--glycine ligase [Nitrospirota bacterium]
GGMGAYSPAPVITEEIQQQVMREVMIPAVKGFQTEGTPYRGVLYAGLMITSKGPRVLEFNCRFGDPEAQVLLSRLDSDLVDIIEATLSGRLTEVPIRWSSKKSVCVVIASGGYPDQAETGREITGVSDAEQETDVKVFHAATIRKDGHPVTSGGRVLGVTAWDENMEAAIQKAYRAVGRIRFEGMHYRKDIGARALNRKEEKKR